MNFCLFSLLLLINFFFLNFQINLFDIEVKNKSKLILQADLLFELLPYKLVKNTQNISFLLTVAVLSMIIIYYLAAVQ